jgi:hypothetical protein
MVTDDYRGLPKGRVRPVAEKTAHRSQNGRKETALEGASSKLCLGGDFHLTVERIVFSARSLPDRNFSYPPAFAGRALDCGYLRESDCIFTGEVCKVSRAQKE